MECSMDRGFEIQGSRRGFNALEKAELWDRWQRGESLKAIGRAFGKPSLVDLFSGGPTWGDSSCTPASFAVGTDAPGARGDIARDRGASIGAVDG